MFTENKDSYSTLIRRVSSRVPGLTFYTGGHASRLNMSSSPSVDPFWWYCDSLVSEKAFKVCDFIERCCDEDIK